MIRRSSSLFTAGGSLTFVTGIGMWHWIPASFADFAGGFLIGVSIALLMLGLTRQSRGISR
jgi:hypothetical protein